LLLIGVLSLSAAVVYAQAPSSGKRVVIAASTVLDGRGKTLHDVRIVVEGSKIVSVEQGAKTPADYDLRGLTVLPGWIDAHVHITWIFGKD
jgi:imidazolonepropionase-like amidohydrolase